MRAVRTVLATALVLVSFAPILAQRVGHRSIPDLDPGLVEPMALSYRVALSLPGRQMVFHVARSIEISEFNGAPTWRIISRETSEGGAVLDTFFLDARTFLPIYRKMERGGAQAVLDYGPHAVKGILSMGDNQTRTETPLASPAFGDGPALELVLSAMSLREEGEDTLSIFDMEMQTVRLLAVKTGGIDTVTVPAGSFKAYVLDLMYLDGSGDGGTALLRADRPRCVVYEFLHSTSQGQEWSIIGELESIAPAK